MNLKLITITAGVDEPTLSISNSGIFIFNKSAIQELNLKPNMKVNFFQNIEKPTDWYVEISEDGLYILKDKVGVNLIMYNLGLSKLIKTSNNIPLIKKVKFRLGKPFEQDGKQLIALNLVIQ